MDYRKLNEATKVASYPLPNMTETLDRLADAKFFTTIHEVSGYHQIEVAPEDWHKTAFVSPFGLFQSCRLGLPGSQERSRQWLRTCCKCWMLRMLWLTWIM